MPETDSWAESMKKTIPDKFQKHWNILKNNILKRNKNGLISKKNPKLKLGTQRAKIHQKLNGICHGYSESIDVNTITLLFNVVFLSYKKLW